MTDTLNPPRTLSSPQTPGQEQATVPWHQDVAYLSPECWSTMQLTAWIPLLNATEHNGCMQVRAIESPLWRV